METIDNKARQKAEKRVEELRGFYNHCVTYVIVNLLLFCINLLQSPGHWWFFYPLFGWGIGLTMNGLSICKNGLWGESWKEHKIEELMNKK